MITIEEIKEKAKKGYMKYLSALVAGKAFEPIEIPFSKKVSDDFATFENEQTCFSGTANSKQAMAMQ